MYRVSDYYRNFARKDSFKYSKVNWSHPLTKGLLFYLLFNENTGLSKDLIYGIPGNKVVTQTQWGHGRDGLSQNWTGTPSVWYERGIWNEPPIATWACRLRRTGTLGSFARPFGKTRNNGGTSPFVAYDIEFNPGGSGQAIAMASMAQGTTLHRSDSGGNNTNLVDSTISMTLAGVYDGEQISLWKNGQKLDGNTAPSGNITYDATSTGRFIVSGASSATELSQWIGEIYWIGVWNRILLAEELKNLHFNPYPFIDSVSTKRYFWFVPPAAAAAVTTADQSFVFSGW